MLSKPSLEGQAGFEYASQEEWKPKKHAPPSDARDKADVHWTNEAV